MEYTFAEDAPILIKNAKAADAQVIGNALEKINRIAGGVLKPAAVVEAASFNRHPLHKHFEWDDTKAAYAHRIDQARSIIRIVRVTDKNTEDGTTRAFESVRLRNGTGYRAIEDIRTSAEFQIAILTKAEQDLEAFRRRYANLEDVCDIVAKAQKKLRARMEEGVTV